MFKKLRTLVSSKIVDIFALSVACMALYMSISQGNVQKNIELANSAPYLQITFNEVDREEIKGLKLSNEGYGSAKIIDFKYYLNRDDFQAQNAQEGNWLPALEPSLQYIFEYINYIPKNYVLNTSEKSNAIYLLGTSAKQLYLKSLKQDSINRFYDSETKRVLENLVIEISYESLNPLDDKLYNLIYCAGDSSLFSYTTTIKN